MVKVLHDSDCALHSAPASPMMPCDCGAGQLPRIVRHLTSVLETNERSPVVVRRDDIRTILAALRDGEA